MSTPVRVLIVDDSPFMRKALERMLVAGEDIQVVGTARDGEDALAQIQSLKPDIVTLDVEMPRMDGLTCLKQIMARHPLPSFPRHISFTCYVTPPVAL